MNEFFGGSELVDFPAPKSKKFLWAAAPLCIAIVAVLVLWVPASRSLSSQNLNTTTLPSSLKTTAFPDTKVEETNQIFEGQPVGSEEVSRSVADRTTVESRALSIAKPVLPSKTTESNSSSALAVEGVTEATKKSTTTAKPVTTAKPTTTEKTTTTKRLPTPSAIQLNELRQCQTGGDYESVNPSGVNFGAYDFMQNSWDAMAARSGRTDLVGVRPDKAKSQDQDALALELYYGGYTEVSWPDCGALLL